MCAFANQALGILPGALLFGDRHAEGLFFGAGGQPRAGFIALGPFRTSRAWTPTHTLAGAFPDPLQRGYLGGR
jgi:hypothetical protein